MRAQLIAGSLACALALAPRPALARDSATSDLEIVRGFAAAVQEAYDIERERHAAVLDSIPAGLAERMEASVRRIRTRSGEATDFTTVARNRKKSFASDSLLSTESALESDTQFLKAFYALLRPDLEALDDPRSRQVKDAVQAFQTAQLEVAHREALLRLHAFEVKYGPGSPTLNVVEILENFWLQRVPPFKPGGHGPSPWEMASLYSTTYLTTVEGAATFVSVVELGLRHYDFSYDPDVKAGLRSYLVPRYWTAAFVIGDGEDGALRLPFRRAPRFGGSLSWGDLKVAYLHGDDERWRLLVSRQLQVIPHLF
jgi:hypothetical protein